MCIKVYSDRALLLIIYRISSNTAPGAQLFVQPFRQRCSIRKRGFLLGIFNYLKMIDSDPITPQK